MQTRLSWKVTVIWLVASVLAVLSCSVNLWAARMGDEYILIGNDSYYHARRILDTARDPQAFYEFDTRIHAPEGSLLPWPWGYDYAMAWLVRLGTAIGLSSDPLTILVWIPVAAVPISLAFLILIGRRIGLTGWPLTLAALCMALAPTTQLLHAVGQIDHHFAEMIFLLAMIATGLAWLEELDSRKAAALLALTLGLAPAIHNGSFILQIPILAALFVFWLQRKRASLPAALVFAAVLTGATLLILLPSTAFRTGRFEFYTLSWFHLYAAGCTAAAAILMSRLEPNRRGVLTLFGSSAVLLIPGLTQLDIAKMFLSGDNEWLAIIGEMQSPAQLAKESGTVAITRIYSYLIYLAPVTAVFCAVQCWRERMRPRLLFWLSGALGLVLLSLQLRLHYFGDFALYLPWFVVAQDLATRHPVQQKKIFLSATLGVLLLYASVLRYQLLAPMPKANDFSFENLHPVFATLRKACAKDPGIVLADPNAGHFLRYYTDCSVIANNFLLTSEHFAKIDEVKHLFSLPASTLPSEAPQVKYVLVRPGDIKETRDGQVAYKFFFPGRQQLARDLLLEPLSAVPKEYELLHEIRFATLNNAPYARVFRIHQHPANERSVAE